ncbi:hypothetical protein BJX96DRAFT_167599 [Aspergillus floccosus]
MDASKRSSVSPKLAADRAARKREQDRQAQRIAREKTKRHIARLEARIATLSQAHGNGSVKTLLGELEKERQVNETLRATLQTIERFVNAGISSAADFPISRGNGQGQNPPKPVSEEDCQTTGNQILPIASGKQLSPASLHIEEPLNMPALSHLCLPTYAGGNGPNSCESFTNPSGFDILQTIHPSFQPVETKCDCCSSLLYLNDLFERCAYVSSPFVTEQRWRDIDIPIRAIMDGWESVCRIYRLDNVWTILRTADEVIWRRCCGAIERLAIFRIVNCMLRYRAHPSEANLKTLPVFMRIRPSQIKVLHKPLIDFVVWPGLRERLVLFPHQHCSDKFWALFWTSFRFHWPYSLQEAVVRQCPSGLYRYSQPFDQHFSNLQSWCMAPPFFQEFPELDADVPAAMVSPDSESLSPEQVRESGDNPRDTETDVSSMVGAFLDATAGPPLMRCPSKDWEDSRNLLF